MRRPGALHPPAGMAVLDGAAQSAARSAVARRVKATMQNVSAATRRPGQAGQSPPVTPLRPSPPSTPTRVQPPAVGAPAAAADPGRGTRRGRDTGPPAEGAPAAATPTTSRGTRQGRGAGPPAEGAPAAAAPTAEDVARMLSQLDHEPAARAEGLDALAQRLTPGQLDEHASALIDKRDKNLLLNLGRLQLLVERRNETDLDTALALLERHCVSDDSPAWQLLPSLPHDREEQEAIRPMLSGRLDRMLELLCGDHVSWPAGRCELGMLVACADPRFGGLSRSDCDFLHDDELPNQRADWTEIPVASSMEMWRQARAVLGVMPKDMPEEEQVKRMKLAIFSPKKDIDVLTTFNQHGGVDGATIASMVSELADAMGVVALSDRLAAGVRGVARAVAAPAAITGSSGTSAAAAPPPQSGTTDPTAAAFARMYAAPPAMHTFFALHPTLPDIAVSCDSQEPEPEEEQHRLRPRGEAWYCGQQCPWHRLLGGYVCGRRPTRRHPDGGDARRRARCRRARCARHRQRRRRAHPSCRRAAAERPSPPGGT